MMLTIYRRHAKRCEHANEGRDYRRCHCPIHVEGRLGDEYIRASLDTRDLEKASNIIHAWEAKGTRTPTPEEQHEQEQQKLKTVAHVCAQFLKDARYGRKLRPPTLYKYRYLLRALRNFTHARGIRYISEIDVDLASQFRVSWRDQNYSAQKKLERLRAFFRFCEDRSWIVSNPARKLTNPKCDQAPTEPFSRNEVRNIVNACNDYPERTQVARVRAFVLVLRFSGLRIRDVVTLRRDRVQDGKLFLFTAKTGTAVWCPLPSFVTDALEAIVGTSPYYFWTGESKPKSAVGDWQRSLARVFKLASIKKGHAHRFRDTFAVELLLEGVPIERVSVLLGHKSVKVTEKHYAPWVRARQEQLEADVRRTWTEEVNFGLDQRTTQNPHTPSNPKVN